MHHNQYRHLLIMIVLSFVSMYVLMYAMVDTFANVYPNFNQFYMAGLMTAPMVLIELGVMRAMYKNQRVNILIIAASILALGAFFVMIRQQTLVADIQFLKSMIPHHAAALLMCEKAPIKDAEIRELCRKIMVGQRSEIDQMKAKLLVLER